jgi:hypothetical protein
MRKISWTLALMVVLAVVAVAAVPTLTSANVTQAPSLQSALTGEDGMTTQSSPPWTKKCVYCKCGHSGNKSCG